jgi:hypothetical protein
VEDAQNQRQGEALAGPPSRGVPHFGEIFVGGRSSPIEHLDAETQAHDREIGDVALELLTGQRTARRHVVREMPYEFSGDCVRVA